MGIFEIRIPTGKKSPDSRVLLKAKKLVFQTIRICFCLKKNIFFSNSQSTHVKNTYGDFRNPNPNRKKEPRFPCFIKGKKTRFPNYSNLFLSQKKYFFFQFSIHPCEEHLWGFSKSESQQEKRAQIPVFY